MSWAKLDDRLWAHPKIVAAGNEATGIFARCLSYAGGYLTDGRIPLAVALSIAGSKQVLDQVVEAGLLEQLPHTGDYFISDYAHYNPLRGEIEATREARAKAGRKGGLSSKKAA